DDLFPAAEALQIFRFAELTGGDLKLTNLGMQFANADLAERKRMFAQQLLSWVPLAAHVRKVLDERSSHIAPRSRFADELEDHMSEEDADLTLRALISWGRYAELFAYDDHARRFTLENPTGRRLPRRKGGVGVYVAHVSWIAANWRADGTAGAAGRSSH